MDRMTGAELVIWRYAYGWQQGDLARELGVDVKTVRRWERGAFTIPAGVVSRLEGLADDFLARVEALAGEGVYVVDVPPTLEQIALGRELMRRGVRVVGQGETTPNP